MATYKTVKTAEFVARQMILPFGEEFMLLAQQTIKAGAKKAQQIKVIVKEIFVEVIKEVPQQLSTWQHIKAALGQIWKRFT